MEILLLCFCRFLTSEHHDVRAAGCPCCVSHACSCGVQVCPQARRGRSGAGRSLPGNRNQHQHRIV